MCIIQLGSNDSAWECKLLLPATFLPEKVKTQLEEALRRRNARPVKAVPPPPPEEPDPPPPAPAVCDVIADLERVALLIAGQFPERKSCSPYEVIADLFIDEYQWASAEAHQAILALVNRRHFKLAGSTADQRYISILDGALCDHLKVLSVLKEAETKTPAPVVTAPVVSDKQRLRTEASQMYVGQPLDDEPRPRPRLVRSEAPAPTQPAPPAAPTGIAAQLADLEQKSLVFEEAQHQLRQAEPATAALEERWERAQEEIAAITRERERLSAECADANRIVADPNYAQAAEKLARIREIISS
ncbi:MAG TPA: hypothetical protein VEB18_01295 [Candidatus Paceibacterota bacterium]|nr:hypothetical protein [Candidatus Paceibacterota bacterium]